MAGAFPRGGSPTLRRRRALHPRGRGRRGRAARRRVPGADGLIPLACAAAMSDTFRTPGETVMTAAEIVEEIRPLGSDQYKKILFNHGAKEPIFGVKVEELKKIQKRIKKDYQLALDLYDTGIYDAMYLAGLIADDARMTKKDLQHWVDKATCNALGGSTVAWVAAESLHGRYLALEWIEPRKEKVAVIGWATLRSLVGIKDDAELDLAELKQLLLRVQQTLPKEP